MSTAVILPTYNEVQNLPLLTERLFSLPIDDLHLLVLDDNSPDGTGRVADELAEKHAGKMQVIHRAGKLGLGSAYITGFKEMLKTPANFIVQMDADFSHPPEKMVEMMQASRSADIVIGSRYVKGGGLDDKWPIWRKALSSFGNTYARVILGSRVQDMTGGYRLWKREVVEAIPLERICSSGYVFMVEMLYVAEKMGYKIVEVPIYFAERQYGVSKMDLGIQAEAALRVWQLRVRYKDLKA